MFCGINFFTQRSLGFFYINQAPYICIYVEFVKLEFVGSVIDMANIVLAAEIIATN